MFGGVEASNLLDGRSCGSGVSETLDTVLYLALLIEVEVEDNGAGVWSRRTCTASQLGERRLFDFGHCVSCIIEEW